MLTIAEKTNRHLTRIVRGCLLIYPLVIHVAILLQQPVWAAGYLLLIAGSYTSLTLFKSYFKFAIAIFIITGILLFILLSLKSNAWIIYLPPILIPSWLAFIFLKSFVIDAPIISKIALIIEGKTLTSLHQKYTEWLTLIWGITFIGMIIEAFLLAFFTSFNTWSWWVNVGNYLIIALLFIVEIIARPFIIGQRAQLKKMFKVLSKQNWHEYSNH